MSPERTPIDEGLNGSPEALMDALLKRKAETGLDFCTQIGRGDRRAVILRKPVVFNGVVDRPNSFIPTPGIRGDIARHLVVTRDGLMSLEFTLTLDDDDDKLDFIFGLNDQKEYQEKLSSAEANPSEYNGYLNDNHGEHILVLSTPDDDRLYETYSIALSPDVTPEEFHACLELNVKAAQERRKAAENPSPQRVSL